MKRLQYETGQSTVSVDDAAGLRDLAIGEDALFTDLEATDGSRQARRGSGSCAASRASPPRSVLGSWEAKPR